MPSSSLLIKFLFLASLIASGICQTEDQKILQHVFDGAWSQLNLPNPTLLIQCIVPPADNILVNNIGPLCQQTCDIQLASIIEDVTKLYANIMELYNAINSDVWKCLKCSSDMEEAAIALQWSSISIDNVRTYIIQHFETVQAQFCTLAH